MYGKKGLLNYLQNLFAYFQERDKLQLNFYFTIKDCIVDYFERKQIFSNNLQM
jgi:hypothetical protein